MLIMNVAALSGAFYLGIALLAELAFFAVMLWKDNVGIFFTWWGCRMVRGGLAHLYQPSVPRCVGRSSREGFAAMRVG
jgi:hypothetical protein